MLCLFIHRMSIRWLINLENTKWLQYISGLLKASLIAVNAIDKDRKSVLVHCSDGWDRTPQIVALAELLLDPYYRTVEVWLTHCIVYVAAGCPLILHSLYFMFQSPWKSLKMKLVLESPRGKRKVHLYFAIITAYAASAMLSSRPAYSLGCSPSPQSLTLACSLTAIRSHSLPFNGLHLHNARSSWKGSWKSVEFHYLKPGLLCSVVFEQLACKLLQQSSSLM